MTPKFLSEPFVSIYHSSHFLEICLDFLLHHFSFCYQVSLLIPAGDTSQEKK